MRLIRAAFALVLLCACDSGSEEQPPVSSTRVAARPDVPPPPGSVPRGTSAAAEALAPPGPPVTPALIARGRERFLVFCSPCHGAQGHGDGPVVSHGFPAPPSYHQERLRQATPEHVVAVITTGTGRMFPYADRVPPPDRWAIAHYVKALQAAAAERAEAPR